MGHSLRYHMPCSADSTNVWRACSAIHPVPAGVMWRGALPGLELCARDSHSGDWTDRALRLRAGSSTRSCTPTP